MSLIWEEIPLSKGGDFTFSNTPLSSFFVLQNYSNATWAKDLKTEKIFYCEIVSGSLEMHSFTRCRSVHGWFTWSPL